MPSIQATRFSKSHFPDARTNWAITSFFVYRPSGSPSIINRANWCAPQAPRGTSSDLLPPLRSPAAARVPALLFRRLDACTNGRHASPKHQLRSRPRHHLLPMLPMEQSWVVPARTPIPAPRCTYAAHGCRGPWFPGNGFRGNCNVPFGGSEQVMNSYEVAYGTARWGGYREAFYGLAQNRPRHGWQPALFVPRPLHRRLRHGLRLSARQAGS